MGTTFAPHPLICCGTLEAAGVTVSALGAPRLRRVPAMATVRTERRLLALRVFLLRARLLAVRSLLRWVIALRSFIRRHRERIAAGMQPADIRVDPWEWVPISQRKGRLLLPVLIVGAACAATGFMTGRQYERGSPAPSPTAEVVAKNSAVKPGATGEEADLALKGENANAPTEVTQAKPATPHVVVLNPGTADQIGNSRTQASAQVRTPPSTRPADNDVSRRDVTHKKASDDQPSTSRRPMQNYQDLRDYMMRR
jgi:hypothetical protein